jgi:hypothetical protein
MAEPIHPAATHHLPPFVTAPGETDVLFIAMVIFVLLAVIGIGVFYFKLHSLPEQIAHRGQQMQFQIVAVLALLALFTHNHAFWIAGLLLALVPPLPDFLSPLTSIARSLHRMSRNPEATATPLPSAAARPLPPAAARPLPLPQAPPPDADRSGVQQGK